MLGYDEAFVSSAVQSSSCHKASRTGQQGATKAKVGGTAERFMR